MVLGKECHCVVVWIVWWVRCYWVVGGIDWLVGLLGGIGCWARMGAGWDWVLGGIGYWMRLGTGWDCMCIKLGDEWYRVLSVIGS